MEIVLKLRKIPMTKGLVYFPFLVSTLFMWQVRVNAAAEYIIRGINEGPIPNNYETYTLFLIPDEEWASGEKNTELERLYKDFRRFGDVIGEDNLAIWFQKKFTLTDIFKNQQYCDKLKLPYRGPFVAISEKNPDNELEPSDYYTLNLNGITSERISEILDYLGKSIASDAFKWDDTLNTSPIGFLRLRYPVRAAMNEPIKEPKKNLKQIIAQINNLPIEEKNLNTQILVILFITLLINSFLVFKNKRIKLREQAIGESTTIFFLGVVCYYIIYRAIFFEYIGDTVIILILTAIYGLIPQRIVKHIPMMKKIVTYKPS